MIVVVLPGGEDGRGGGKTGMSWGWVGGGVFLGGEDTSGEITLRAG